MMSEDRARELRLKLIQMQGSYREQETRPIIKELERIEGVGRVVAVTQEQTFVAPRRLAG